MGELLYLKASCRAILYSSVNCQNRRPAFPWNRIESIKEERSCEADITSSHMAGNRKADTEARVAAAQHLGASITHQSTQAGLPRRAWGSHLERAGAQLSDITKDVTRVTTTDFCCHSRKLRLSLRIGEGLG
jgi:hypothetical protein